jgi:hypothetical protein
VPTACPGGRPPHLWLEDGLSLYDSFGFEWSLLCLGRPQGGAFLAAARSFGLDLHVVRLDNAAARDLYGADLVLIRPDQVVAWRGNDDGAAHSILAALTGHG